MYRVVFDTNIFLSAFIFGGNPRKVFEFARFKKIKLLTSTSILTEFAARLRDKFDWEVSDIADAVRTVGYSSELIKSFRILKVIEDDPDNRILECALEGKADFIVSGDHQLLDLKEFEEVRIISARELMSIIYNL